VARGEGDRVRFEVVDTGVGFGPDEKARIFERFQQADASITRRFGGMGLGLSISRDLVALMGGTLECESAPAEGSRFWFDLPLPPAAANDVDGAASATPERALRVLVADDHPANRRIVELMLAEAAEVTCVENGLEAVRAYLDDRPDIVLMDMQMPVMDGLSAVSEIRRLEAAGGQARRPIVMLTANAGEEHVKASLAAGADRHLQKPITAATLFGALQAVL
jgi:CheY-like chemotaxis protein